MNYDLESQILNLEFGTLNSEFEATNWAARALILHFFSLKYFNKSLGASRQAQCS